MAYGVPVIMLLLDTCAFLWLVADHKKISVKAMAALKKSAGNIFVSSISAFEIGIKYEKKKLSLPMRATEWFMKALELHGLTELPITAKIAALSTELPRLHDDPADRMIVATAILHKLPLLTPDSHIRQYDSVEVIW